VRKQHEVGSRNAEVGKEKKRRWEYKKIRRYEINLSVVNRMLSVVEKGMPVWIGDYQLGGLRKATGRNHSEYQILPMVTDIKRSKPFKIIRSISLNNIELRLPRTTDHWQPTIRFSAQV
jgi:hypothetical protein